MLRKFILILILISLLAIGIPTGAQTELTGVTTDVINVRSGPGSATPILGQIPDRTEVVLEARNEGGDWAIVRTNAIRGWVASGFIAIRGGYDVSYLPVSSERFDGAPPPVVPAEAPPSGEVPAAPVVPAPTGGEASATTKGTLNLRTAPGTGSPVITQFSANTSLIVEGRNEVGDWVLVHTPDNALRGWVASRFLNMSVAPAQLAVVTETFSPNTDAASNAPPLVPVGSIDSMVAELNAVPILYNFSTRQVRTIFAAGKRLGNRANVFTKVGDSISATQPFLSGFAHGEANLGPYGHLQGTLDFFMTTPPREGQANSFNNNSIANSSAFSSGAVLDVVWSDPAVCGNNEAPLLCEYRLVKPAVAIIMLGSVDIQAYPLELYNHYMRRVVSLTIQQGVIPVLTLFPIPPEHQYYEQSLRFNLLLLDIAKDNGIPVINLWKAVRTLPANGLGGDRFHLSQAEGPFHFSFNGEENQYGVTMRNLITLQALDELRRTVPLR